MPAAADTDREGWAGLLRTLTDEELTQYGQMALDQVRQETSRALLHVVMLLAAVALITWAGWTIYHLGEAGWLVYGALAAATLFVYLPWQSIKVRKLWLGHCRNVKVEQKRRAMHAARPPDETDDA